MGISSVCANHKWCTNERMVAGLGLIVLITGIALFIIQGIHVVPKSTSLLPAAKALTGVGTSLVAISFLFYTCMSCCDRLEKIIKEKNAETPSSNSSQSRVATPTIEGPIEHVRQSQQSRLSTPASPDSSLHAVPTPHDQPPSSSALHSPPPSSESSPVLNLPILEPDHAQSAAEFFNGKGLFWVSQDENFCYELDKLKKSSESKIVEIKLWGNSPLAMENVPQAIYTFLGGGVLDLGTCIQKDLQDAMGTGAAILKKLEESKVKNLTIILKTDFSTQNAHKIIDSINEEIKLRKINCILVKACTASLVSSMSKEIITIVLEPLHFTKDLAIKVLVDALRNCQVFNSVEGISNEQKQKYITHLNQVWQLPSEEAQKKFDKRLVSSGKFYLYPNEIEPEIRNGIEQLQVDNELENCGANTIEAFLQLLQDSLSKNKEVNLFPLLQELFNDAD